MSAPTVTAGAHDNPDLFTRMAMGVLEKVVGAEIRSAA